MSQKQPQSIHEAIASARQGQARFWMIAISWLAVMGLVSYYFVSVLDRFEDRQKTLERDQTAQLFTMFSLESRLQATIPLLDQLKRAQFVDLSPFDAPDHARVIARNWIARAKLFDAEEDFLAVQTREVLDNDGGTAEAAYFEGIWELIDEGGGGLEKAAVHFEAAVERLLEPEGVAGTPREATFRRDGVDHDEELLRASLAAAARCRQRSKGHREAVEHASRLIELLGEEAGAGSRGGDPTLYDPLAEAHALRAFSRYKLGLELRVNGGDANEVNRLLDDSAADSQAAIERDPQYWVPYHYLGFAHFLRSHNAEAAAEWENAARRRMSTKEVAGSLENIGLAHLNAGEWQKALDNSEVVLLVHPVENESPWNALMRGIALVELGHGAESELAFDQWRKGGDESDVYALKQYLEPSLHGYVRLE